jgi:hypothetical protein
MEERRSRVLENKGLRRIYGPKREGGVGGWTKLYGGELHYLYVSPTSISVIKSRRMRWASHAERMG